MEIFLVVLSFFAVVISTSLLMLFLHDLSKKVSRHALEISVKRKKIKKRLRTFQEKCRNIKSVIARIILYNNKKRFALFFIEPLKAIAVAVLPFGKFKKTVLLFDVLRKFVVFFIPRISR